MKQLRFSRSLQYTETDDDDNDNDTKTFHVPFQSKFLYIAFGIIDFHNRFIDTNHHSIVIKSWHLLLII